MSASAEFVDAVQGAVAGTPYTVTKTPMGFDLNVNLADARWLGVVRAHGLTKLFACEVRLEESKRRMVIVDVSSTVSWTGGAFLPQLIVDKRVTRGRVYEWSWRRDYGLDLDTGEIGEVVDYTFNSNEGRDIIRSVARMHGWVEAMSLEQKGAVVMAAIGGLLMVGTAGPSTSTSQPPATRRWPRRSTRYASAPAATWATTSGSS